MTDEEQIGKIRQNAGGDEPPSMTISGRSLSDWVLSLTAIARTGLAFTDSLYERERYEEILKVVTRMQATADRKSVV